MNQLPLPTVNAVLNSLSSILLVLGYIQIKSRRPSAHKTFMIAALFSSALFLIGYVIYHYTAGSMPYPHHDWTRPVYFVILITHIMLAAFMVPFVLAAVYFALKGNFTKHKRLTRWVWPVWMYVSVTGIVIYIMLYRV